MKRVIAILSCALFICALNTGVSFAETQAGTSGDNTVPAVLNLTATSIDFSISTEISLTGVTDSVDLTCTDLKVVNNLHAGAIQVTKVTATANSTDGWSLVAFSTNFEALPLNSKQLGLKCEGVDMYNGDSYGPTAAIEPQKELDIKFAAKTGATASDISDATVANVVATVAMVDTSSTVPK